MLVFEDDISFETLSAWGRQGLVELGKALEPTEWTVCQLSYMLGYVEGATLAKANKRLWVRGELVRRRDAWDDADLFGTAAYLVHPRGMVAVLARHWPGGLEAARSDVEWSELGHGVFDLRAPGIGGGTWDGLVYSLPQAYVATRPLFLYAGPEEGLGSTRVPLWTVRSSAPQKPMSLTCSLASPASCTCAGCSTTARPFSRLKQARLRLTSWPSLARSGWPNSQNGFPLAHWQKRSFMPALPTAAHTVWRIWTCRPSRRELGPRGN